MSDFLEMVLAARRKGDGGWIQLLIPIVFVVIYALSGIAKLKKGTGDEESKLKERPSLKDTEGGKFRYKALDEAGARQRPVGPRPVPPRAKTLPYAKPGAPGTPRQRPTLREPLPAQPRQPQPAARRPQPTAQPRSARVPSRMRPQEPPVRPGPIRPAQAPPRPKPKPIKPKTAPRVVQKPRKPQKVAATEVKPPAQIVRKRASLRADLSGSSNLQRAIIYSEILGKPLALRDM